MIKKKITSKSKTVKSLKNKATANTTVVKKSDGMEHTLKAGAPLDPNVKYEPNTIGLAKGITKNMDNYESLRVDCWLSLKLPEEFTLEDAHDIYNEMSEIVESQLEEEVSKAIE